MTKKNKYNSIKMNSVLISNKEKNNSTLMDFIFVVLNAYVADVESNGKQI